MSDKKSLNIIHLYPDLLNLYGDKGNLASIEMRLKWRGIDANVITPTSRDREFDIDNADIIFLGGGSDKEQEIACEFLREKKDELKSYVESGGTLVAVCGGYTMLGEYYCTADKKVEALGILDIYTEYSDKRFIGNVVLETDLFEQKIVGFENRASKTFIGDYTPLGKVVCGYGNIGDGGYEGLIYKNVVASYLHGPLLPKNPMLCDYILSGAMKKKYSDFNGFEPLSDELENLANKSAEERFTNE